LKNSSIYTGTKELTPKKLFYYFNIIITFVLSFVLIFAGISKIIDPSPLINNLTAAFNFLPGTVLILISTILPLIELSLGLLLIFSLYKGNLKSRLKIILIVTTSLFGLFLAYSIYGYIIGLKNDCGCFGNAVKADFGVGMIIRNSSFLLLSVCFLFISKGDNN
jgi:hypothetical protein